MLCLIEGPDRSVRKPSFIFVFVDQDLRSIDLRIYIYLWIYPDHVRASQSSARASLISSKHHDQRDAPRYVGLFIVLVLCN
jgi:hypothetical protein